MKGIRLIYLAHSIDTYRIKNNYNTFVSKYQNLRIVFIEKILVSLCNKIIVLSERDKTILLDLFQIQSNQVKCCSNGIDNIDIVKEYDYVFDRTLKIITVGSFDRKEKALQELVEVLSTLDTPIILTVCNHVKQDEPILKKSKISIEFKPPMTRKELRYEFIKNDLFCIFSSYESFSLSLLEAMNSGLLILASDRVGLTERFDANISQFVFPFGDWKEAKGILDRIVQSPISERIDMSKNIINFTHNFLWKKVIEEYFELYQESII